MEHSSLAIGMLAGMRHCNLALLWISVRPPYSQYSVEPVEERNTPSSHTSSARSSTARDEMEEGKNRVDDPQTWWNQTRQVWGYSYTFLQAFRITLLLSVACCCIALVVMAPGFRVLAVTEGVLAILFATIRRWGSVKRYLENHPVITTIVVGKS